MINPNPVKEKRAKSINDAQGILDKALEEKRDLTAEERIQLDTLQTDAETLTGDIERIERQNKMEMEHTPSFEPRAVDSDRKEEKRSAFFKYMRGNKLDQEERSLVEDTTGAILVPEDLQDEIMREIPQYNVIRQLANIRQTTRNKVAKRSLTEASMSWGKLETGAIVPEADLTPSKDYIHVEDLSGVVKIGRDELQDTDEILGGIIRDSFALAKANTEARAFILGTGHSNSQPDGITLNATIIANYIDLDTADTIVPDDLLDIEYDLPSQYLGQASFIMHRSTEGMLRKAKATSSYLWTPNIVGAPAKIFDGYPLNNSVDMVAPASTNTDRAIVALFGNWKLGYTIVDRMGLAIQRLDELFALSGRVGFLAYFRVGGGVDRPDAFRALNNNT